MTLVLPDKLYIQIENLEGNVARNLDDIETHCWERVHASDVVYVRAGKRVPGRAELAALRDQLVVARGVIESLEEYLRDDPSAPSVSRLDGRPVGVWWASGGRREDKEMGTIPQATVVLT
ncbi:MAG: hypothetical protein R3C43_09820 [Chloroflexota bacterium]